MLWNKKTIRKRKKTHLYAGILGISLLLAGVGPSLGQDDPPFPAEPEMPGVIEGTGTDFAVTDSEYLNVTLQSTEPVQLRLESVPEMIVIRIQAAEGATATQITLGGLAPSTTYYMYQDDYHNLTTLLTDDAGVCTYAQDLAEPRVVFIQPRPSTKFIPSDPSIGTWDAVNRVYTLTTDVEGTIQVDEDNLTLDGAGHTITGADTGNGVYLNGRTGVTITNVTVQDFQFGIGLDNSDNNTLIGNTVSDNIWGISLTLSDANTLTGNTATNNRDLGIRLYQCDSNVLTGNTVWDNGCGISLGLSRSHTLTGNTMSGNTSYGYYKNFSIAISGPIEYLDHDIDTSNTVDGKPLYYVVGDVGGVYDSSTNAGLFYAISCNGITIKDLTLTAGIAGLVLFDTHNSTIKNVTASNNKLGICLSSSSGNAVMTNDASNNDVGISLRDSSTGNTLTGNTTSNNASIGIHLAGPANTLTNNIASYNHIGFGCSGDFNSLNGNTASHNVFGFECGGESNTLNGNTASSNNHGIRLLLRCTSYTLTGNSMSGNVENFLIHNRNYDSWPDLNIDTSNTVDGKPVYYVVGDVGGVYDSSTNAGLFFAISCDGITIKDLTLTNNHVGVMLWNTHNSTIENVTTSNNRYGIWLYSSFGNTLTGNTASDNIEGIRLAVADANTLLENAVSHNNSGIVLDRGSANNTLDGNTADSNDGAGIQLTNCVANTLTRNSTSNNSVGMEFRGCSDHQTWNNNFINNQTQARVTYSSGNVFNLPSPIGGNHWSDWTSPDSDGDGVVDVPYVFTGGQDNLPWVVQDGWEPATMIEQIVSDVLTLNLQHGIENSLDSKLDAAQQALDDVNNNNNVAAINALQAFINAVQAQSGVHIPVDDANALIAAAQQIIDMLNAT